MDHNHLQLYSGYNILSWPLGFPHMHMHKPHLDTHTYTELKTIFKSTYTPKEMHYSMIL